MKQVRTRGKQLRPLLDAVKWVLLWITVALAAAAMIWSALGQELALQFLGGYLIELSLSMDNLFVFMSILRRLELQSMPGTGCCIGAFSAQWCCGCCLFFWVRRSSAGLRGCCICLEHCW